jgi:hypothetical protein
MIKKDKIVIHNIKGSDFRQLHVDGASAGITPTGYINVNLYSQRNVIPKGTIFNINEDGSLGDLIGSTDDSKEGIVREYDFGFYTDINTCKSIIDLLEQKVKEYEKLFAKNK